MFRSWGAIGSPIFAEIEGGREAEIANQPGALDEELDSILGQVSVEGAVFMVGESKKSLGS